MSNRSWKTLVTLALLALASPVLSAEKPNEKTAVKKAAQKGSSKPTAKTPAEAETIKPSSVVRLVADGKHNAFTALIQWKESYWLAFRKAPSHAYGEADIIVMNSTDTKNWKTVLTLNILPDDRDPQFVATKDRLFLYTPCLLRSKCTSFVSHTDDGKNWSKPQKVYEERYILWKPIVHEGTFWATAHHKAEGKDGGKIRDVHLIRSKDGIEWEKVSTIRAGNWESETTIHFQPSGEIIAFLRQKYGGGGSFMEAKPPYTHWSERPSNVHLSGHAAYEFDGVTYLFSRSYKGRSAGTTLYTYDGKKLVPYCEFPSGGDCSYPAAVRIGDEMLVSYYSTHEGTTDIYLARVPLKKTPEKKTAAK